MGLDMFLCKIKKKKGVTLEEILKSKDTELEDMIYWRKANQIHNWFVKNVQNGVDEGDIYEVSKEQLQELLKVCQKVYKSSILVDGKVHNGDTYEGHKRVPIIEPGKVIKDNSVAEKYLPTCDGYFFGSTDYDEYYMEDIRYTIEELEKILEDFDFDNNYVVYHAWW